MRPASPARPSPFLRPVVLGPLALLVLAGGAFGVMQWLAAGEAATARGRLLADVEASAGKQPPDRDDLQRLMVQVEKLPDHAEARDALAAKARILLARDRAEAARDLFGAVASQPGASASEQGLGARIFLRVHEGGVADPAASAGLLGQVVQLAEASYRQSRAPGDLLRAWQAAERAGETERARGFAKTLADDHADSGEAKFVAFANAFDPAVGVAAVRAAMAACPPGPVEGLAMLAFAELQAADVPAAVATVEAALARAPGVGVVRWAAAVVFHACVVGSAAGSEERARWVERRDAQLSWVVQQPSTDEARRQQAARMREQQ